MSSYYEQCPGCKGSRMMQTFSYSNLQTKLIECSRCQGSGEVPKPYQP